MISSNSNSSNAAIPWLLCAVILLTIQNSVLLPQGAGNYFGDKKIQNTTTGKSEEHVNFLTRSSEESDEDSHHNDSLMCFPYFISQDVDSLLNQAVKMLSKSKNDRQKSWLQLFVNRLESLSTQLRQLPTEHKNRCFHIRERLATDRLEDHLASAPEEIQLRFARKLFLAARPRVNAIPRNNRLKQYVTGTVSKGQNQAPPEYKTLPEARSNTQQSSQSDNAQNAHQSNKYIEENSKTLAKLDVGSAFSNSHGPVSRNQYRNRHSSVDATSFPLMTRWESQNMEHETMPFLPRATRKLIPRPIEDTMKFRLLSSLRNHRTTTTDQSKDEIPIVLPVIENEHSKDSVEDVKEQLISTNSPLEDQHHREPSTQQYEESVAQLHDQEFNSPPLTNLDNKASSSDLSTLQTTHGTKDNNDDDDNDDLIAQLHSGGKYANIPKPRMHPRLSVNSKQANNWPQATPFQTASHSPSTEKISSNEDLVKTNTPVSNINAAQHDDASEINKVRNNNELTNLDFDYEEQGAAAGELFIDDEVVPTKFLVVPSSVGSVENIDSNEDDDIVKQLDELKSLKTSNIPSDHPTTDARLALSTDGAPVKNIPHLLDDK